MFSEISFARDQS